MLERPHTQGLKINMDQLILVSGRPGLKNDISGVTQMPNLFTDRWEGPITGLRLPLAVWKVLINEGIRTVDQLSAVADRLEQLPGIGPAMARVTRDELARASFPEGSLSGRG